MKSKSLSFRLANLGHYTEDANFRWDANYLTEGANNACIYFSETIKRPQLRFLVMGLVSL